MIRCWTMNRVSGEADRGQPDGLYHGPPRSVEAKHASAAIHTPFRLPCDTPWPRISVRRPSGCSRSSTTRPGCSGSASTGSCSRPGSAVSSSWRPYWPAVSCRPSLAVRSSFRVWRPGITQPSSRETGYASPPGHRFETFPPLHEPFLPL